ncbi:methyltransferase [Pseudomassariella vexata]|uniref:Methyltransferase n=1 Tax=Pseudomassariella vexata TaxID=1141098 RepID=A0A1Y2EB59_9PEZI|nr:methyltransferase [Pseudomassariella vexata]ORY68792.1 methyltransferase [Pseudomassariella vexata]
MSSSPSPSPSLLARTHTLLWALADPWLFMAISASWLPSTILTLLRNRELAILLSPSKLQGVWFGRFWGWAGPNIKLSREPMVISLLEGRTCGGRVVEEPTGNGIEGVVVEIGAGSGFWVDVFKERDLGKGEGKASSIDGQAVAGTGAGVVKRTSGVRGLVTRIYGVEPNREQHPSLRQKISEAGLEDVYEIVPVGIEDLDNPSKWDGKVEKGSVDCIVSILCLCSIPEPQKNFKELYGYLKKGGRWYVFEHVRAEGNWGIRIFQAFTNLFWPHFLGGCQLCRPTEKWLREAGPWDKVDVGQPPGEQWHHCVPHILGVFTK